eukprot:TRINITY_DN79878_c0_g1_i1.p1 TRINITY_DN79878_c0_g1~~TRINITY_DN79878_c0_g1_i1.p1  ORF type:complete len:490 (+),score=104.52 TRINITY_DN79878_c0_g1_i1:74-1543(+)
MQLPTLKSTSVDSPPRKSLLPSLLRRRGYDTPCSPHSPLSPCSPFTPASPTPGDAATTSFTSFKMTGLDETACQSSMELPGVPEEDKDMKAPPTGRLLGGLRQRRQQKLSILCSKKDTSEHFESFCNSQAGMLQQYELHEILGQGSSGVVYRALRKSDNKQVAVKTMQAFDEEMLAIRRQEFELLQKLRHPHIIEAVDFFASPGHAALVLEFFPGQTLSQTVKQAPSQQLAEDVSRQLFLMLLQAIDCLHQHRIVHRDVKGENVLISSSSRLNDLRLIDFNAARCVLEGGALTMTGTLEYAAPEVLQGESPSEGADIWSAGLCLHLMLAGSLPWRMGQLSMEAYHRKVTTHELQLDGTSWQEISDECKEMLQLCLTIQKTMRPAAMVLLEQDWLQASAASQKFQHRTQSLHVPSNNHGQAVPGSPRSPRSPLSSEANVAATPKSPRRFWQLALPMLTRSRRNSEAEEEPMGRRFTIGDVPRLLGQRTPR